MRGKSMLCFGAPGVGKTALLTHIEDRQESWGVVAVNVESSDLNDGGMLFERVCRALAPKRQAKSDVTAAISIAGKLGVSGSGVSRASSHPSVVDRAARSRGFPWIELREHVAPLLGGRPLALLVDEAQAMAADEGTNGCAALLHLHKGDPSPFDKLPVFGVFGGLSETSQVLGSLGVSRLRLDGLCPLQPLKDLEAERYVEGILEHLEAEGSEEQKRAVARWVSDGCGGWPRHLRNHMRAIALGMVAQDSARLETLDRNLVEREAARGRNVYYAGRMSGALAGLSPLVRDVLDAAESGRDDYESLLLAAEEAIDAKRRGLGKSAGRTRWI